MKHIAGFLIGCFILLIGQTAPAHAEQFVGLIQSVTDNAVILRDSESVAARPGMQIEKGDVVETDRHGTVAIVFSDDTVISMGPGTRLVIDDYMFEPLEKKLSFVARILRGTVSYLSGQIAKIAPESVRISIPAAVIGVRGTHVLIKVE